MNTGVQRMVRGMFAALARRTEVTPLLWSPKLNSYCRLAPQERQFLIKPFARHQTPSAKPERLVTRFPWSKTVRYLRNRKGCIALDAVATTEDLLLVPEIFQDNRIEWLADGTVRFSGRRFAVFHDAIALRLPDFTAPERQHRFPDYVRALAVFDKIVCVSREVESDLRFCWSSFGVAATTISVLGWPTDFGIVRPAPQPNFAAKRVLCVATLERRKNHLRLLEAAENLWSAGLRFELVLIGRTTADWGSTVLAQVERLTKRGRALTWRRHVDDLALHAAYCDCSFTVYPSLREGFGLPVLESLWHGRPCICSDKGALGEVADGGGCLIGDPTNTDALTAAMRELLTNEATYRRLFDQTNARRFRSWDDYIHDLLREIAVA
jgi:glycosyltransferase involved in cell wall biosynthesis